MSAIKRYRKSALLLAVLGSMLAVSGCKRSQDAFDDRTLEKRPHTESVRPADRKDAFRP
ncbi:MAG TPA: hypothetical protein VEK08_14815 [Planctomycetota bacterium]|nr:hypothetical protein [Planctomycetota bacterium]